MKRTHLFFSVLFLAGFFVATPPVRAADTGFVNTPLWISPETPKEGDQVTLSVLFHNAESEIVTGKILFYDGLTLLADKMVTVRPDEVATVSTVFTIAAGGHLFSASTSNMTHMSTTGTVEVVTLPQPTVKLPVQFVSKSLPLGAQANGATGSPIELVHNQLEKAKEGVAKIVPDTTKKKVSTTAKSIDNWRSDKAETFTDSRDDAKKSLDDAKKPSNKVAGTSSTGGPFTYIKYLIVGALAFLFSKALVFYLVILLIIYFFFRYLFRRFRRNRQQASQAKK